MTTLGPITGFIFAFFIQLGFIIVPLILGILGWSTWIEYIQTGYKNSLDFVTLYIKIPQEIRKHPGAMELVLNAMYQTGGVGTWYNRWWEGKVRTWFSLEIVSIEGKVYFFMRMEKRFVDVVLPQIYAQYPEVEAFIVDDYTQFIDEYTKENDWSMWGTEFAFTKSNTFPLKTYIDYGFDNRALAFDENQRIDPISPLLEHMGSMTIGEQIWTQIIITPSIKRFQDPKSTWIINWLGVYKKRDWLAEAKDDIKKFIEENSPVDPETKKPQGSMTKAKNEILELMERKASKYGFDAGIRVLYLAKKDRFRSSSLVGLLGGYRQYNTNNLNSMKPDQTTDFDPWKDLLDKKLEEKKMELFRAYVERRYFGMDDRTPMVLNTEELATMYHFPGAVSETPLLERMGSKKSEAPIDLPT